MADPTQTFSHFVDTAPVTTPGISGKVPVVQSGITYSITSDLLVGPQGPAGAQGPTGAAGPTGATGAPGPPGVGTLSGMTVNQFALAGSATAVTSSAMFWDSANSRLGVGTTTPAAKVSVAAGNVALAANTLISFAGPTVAPSAANYVLTGDTTGATLSSGGNTPVIFVTNATEKARLTATGRLGIGQSIPAQPLDVLGNARVTGSAILDGSGGGVQFFDRDASGNYTVVYRQSGATRFWQNVAGDTLSFTATGNVGVGIVGPTTKLQVTAPSGTNPLEITTADFVSGSVGSGLLFDFGGYTGNVYTRLSALGTGNMSWQNLILQSGGGNVGVGNLSPGQKLDVSGNIGISQNGWVGWSNNSASYMPDEAGLGGALRTPGSFRFFTGGASERMRIDAAGNVGIGNNAPTYRLEVNGSARTQGSHIADGPAGAFQLFDRDAGGSYNTIYRQSGVTRFYGSVAGDLMSFTNTGNVGIGTIAPNYRFEVNALGTASVGDIVGRFCNTHNTAGDSVMQVTGGVAGADTTTYLMQFGSVGEFCGGIKRNGTAAVAYGTTSDMRLKNDIADSDIGIDALMALKVREFSYPGDPRRQQGLMAQELAEVYPVAVCEGGENPTTNPWLVDYGRITPLLVRTIQQQQGVIEKLEKRLAALERRKH